MSRLLMPTMIGRVNERQIATAIRRAEAALAPDVVRIRYTLGEDSTGLASIFFRVLLSNRASKEAGLYERAVRIRRKIMELVKPLEKFGIEAYFHYRSVAEQAELRDAEWE